MASTLRERTVLPPDDLSELARFARNMSEEGDTRARLVGPDGSTIDLPEELHDVLRDVVAALSQGLAISIAPHNTMLTTQEAADLLAVSRPTLVRLLEESEIPFSMRGRHRRVLLRDVLNYQEHTRREREQVLDQMAVESEEMDLYDTTAVPRNTR